MRTDLFSKKSLYIFSAFLFGLIFGLSFWAFSNRTFAETDIPLEESEAYTFTPEEKFITIFDGSSKRTVRSSASTVKDLLDRLNVVLSETDSVSPSLDTEIDADNFFINIYRSRPVLVIDGTVSKIVNVSSFDPKTAVRSAGFTVYDEDRVETVSIANFLETGISSALKIIRGSGKTVTIEEDLPFETKTVKSYDIPEGSEKVESLGELGKIRRVFRVKTLDGTEVERELVEEEVLRAPVDRVVAVGSPKISQNPLSPSMGRNRYTTTNLSGATVERQETFYDLPMSVVMSYCGKSSYTVREDGAKVDEDGYVLVAAALSRYPRCSVVETSLGPGKVYDTGGFAASNPEQFDLATDWTNHDGR